MLGRLNIIYLRDISFKPIFNIDWGKMPRWIRRTCASYPLRTHLTIQSRFYILERSITIFTMYFGSQYMQYNCEISVFINALKYNSNKSHIRHLYPYRRQNFKVLL